MNLNGHLAEAAGLCYDCQQPLDPAGYYSRYVELSQTKAFAAAICRECKAKQAHCDKSIEEDGIRYECTMKPGHKGKCDFQEAY